MSGIKWIKITTDIFDDEKIKLIDTMPDRDALIVIWFKILALAGKKNACGMIFLSEKVPYTDEMLATIFNRPLNTLRLALETFQNFDMIEISENNIISITNWEKHQNIDGMEKVRKQNAERQKRFKAKQKKKQLENQQKKAADSEQNEGQKKGGNVTVTLSNATEETRLEEEKIREKEISLTNVRDTKKSQPPTENFNSFLIQWNNFAKENDLQTLIKISDERKEMLRERIQDPNFDFNAILEKIKESKFLLGKSETGNWKVDFDFIIKNDTNFLKILEGKYAKSNNQSSSFEGSTITKSGKLSNEYTREKARRMGW